LFFFCLHASTISGGGAGGVVIALDETLMT
jgi:hypothetical protein